MGLRILAIFLKVFYQQKKRFNFFIPWLAKLFEIWAKCTECDKQNIINRQPDALRYRADHNQKEIDKKYI